MRLHRYHFVLLIYYCVRVVAVQSAVCRWVSAAFFFLPSKDYHRFFLSWKKWFCHYTMLLYTGWMDTFSVVFVWVIFNFVRVVVPFLLHKAPPIMMQRCHLPWNPIIYLSLASLAPLLHQLKKMAHWATELLVVFTIIEPYNLPKWVNALRISIINFFSSVLLCGVQCTCVSLC